MARTTLDSNALNRSVLYCSFVASSVVANSRFVIRSTRYMPLGYYNVIQPKRMLDDSCKFDELLDAAIAKRDADELEIALALGFEPKESRTFLFETLLVETWHHSHEYFVRYLQDHPLPSSVQALKSAMLLKPQLEYLRYDDYGAYYKKCFWALATNPNSAAIDVIREFTVAEDEALKEQARCRLTKIGRNPRTEE